jgi:very-short-patch-repair endonuclease
VDIYGDFPLSGVGVENQYVIGKLIFTMYTNNYYNKSLHHIANDLRRAMTKAEACLWKYALRARQMRGYSFRRQRLLLNYIADFACLELKLIIEVDGYSHSLEETIQSDIIKQKALEEAGFTVMRFSDIEVLKDMRNVIKQIEFYIENLELKIQSSSRLTST